MSRAGEIISISPPNAIAGGEIRIECVGFEANHDLGPRVTIGGEPCRVVAASSERVVAVVPVGVSDGEANVVLESGGAQSDAFPIVVGEMLVDEMHIVANPAVDPKDDSVVVTRSGTRGQSLPTTLFRVEADGYVDELPAAVMNPTGIAFDRDGEMFVCNRADGVVVEVERSGESAVYASGLGIATGIAFDRDGIMYVGDRRGTIYRVGGREYIETFAVLEPSVAAYHLAFGPDGRLYVTAPALSSHDSVRVIEGDGTVGKYFRGLGRPQGIAFDADGNLYVAASYQGTRGIVRIQPGGEGAQMFVAGSEIVGVCFTRAGDMIVATNAAAYSLGVGIYGTLLG